MSQYYRKTLSGERLKRCYDLAPPRVQKYLSEEINFILERICPGDFLLELGCGYGRFLKELAGKTGNLYGIDNSFENLHFGRTHYLPPGGHHLCCMDAGNPGFFYHQFDLVFCIQNGISAMKIAPEELIIEALHLVKPGGKIILSSYSEKFWADRLFWFRIQAEHGLIGEIDEERTGHGVITCRDGFKATTFSAEQLRALATATGCNCKITEVDDSSLFCEIFV